MNAASVDNPSGRKLHFVKGSDTFSVGQARSIKFDKASYAKTKKKLLKGRGVYVVSYFRSSLGFGFAVDLNASKSSDSEKGILILQSEFTDGSLPQPGDVITGKIEIGPRGAKLTAAAGGSGRSLTPAQQESGVILSYNAGRGHGMILSARGRLFFHVSDVGAAIGAKNEEGKYTSLKASTRVRFTTHEDKLNDESGEVKKRAIAIELDILHNAQHQMENQNPSGVEIAEGEVKNNCNEEMEARVAKLNEEMENRVSKLENQIIMQSQQIRNVAAKVITVDADLKKTLARNHNQLINILESMGAVAGATKEKTKKLKTVRRRSAREQSKPRATKKVEEDESDLLNDDDSEEESISTGMGSSSETDDDGTDEESNDDGTDEESDSGSESVGANKENYQSKHKDKPQGDRLILGNGRQAMVKGAKKGKKRC